MKALAGRAERADGGVLEAQVAHATSAEFAGAVGAAAFVIGWAATAGVETVLLIDMNDKVSAAAALMIGAEKLRKVVMGLASSLVVWDCAASGPADATSFAQDVPI